jgi:hypothetical protein
MLLQLQEKTRQPSQDTGIKLTQCNMQLNNTVKTAINSTFTLSYTRLKQNIKLQVANKIKQMALHKVITAYQYKKGT